MAAIGAQPIQIVPHLHGKVDAALLPSVAEATTDIPAVEPTCRVATEL